MTNPYKEHSKTIRSLIKNAEKGILEAQLQLHEYYAKGKYVDRDETLSKKYLNMLENTLSGKSLRLKTLSLSNFRRFSSINIDFDEKLTVIVGNNGAGKTTLAEAISKIFSWFNNNLERDDVNGRPITTSDINVHATDYAEILALFQLDKLNKFEASLARTCPGFPGSKSSEVSIIKQFGAMYRKAAGNAKIMIPLLSFYSVERSFITLKPEISEKVSGETTSNRFSALKDVLESSGKLDSFSDIYIELVNLAEGEETKEIKDLKTQAATLEKTIHDVFEGRQPPEDDLFLAKLNAIKKQLANKLKSAPSAKFQRHLEFVNQAIETLVPDVKNLEIDRSSGKARLLVENFGNKVNITQLSHGQRMLVALAGDLARRLVTLNPESEAPLKGHGIVIIDEIDLHLHPKWQQEIITGLQRTFPNLQLIITTHSPQVLSTVRRENIRTLEFDATGQVVVSKPLAPTYGEPSGDVLHSVMLVDPQPPIAEKADLLRLTELVDQGLYDEQEATQLMRKLLSVLDEKHPQLLRLQRSIQRQKALKE
jgi:predicted ATP-binding protein involved in virulence